MAITRTANKCGAAVRTVALIVMVPAAATTMVGPAYALGEDPSEVQGETINVSCFKGNLDAGNYIGSVTVTNRQNAGRSCNSTYYDCEGKCLGCFPDANRDRQVCYDNEGQEIAK